MSKARVAVLKIITNELSVTAAAAKYGYSRQHLHRLLARYHAGGLDAVDPRSPATIEHHRLRYDRVDAWGKVSIRRAGTMHHLGVGYAHRGQRILAIADDTTITVINLATGEILSPHTIDPHRHYWRNTQKAPGRWPGAL